MNTRHKLPDKISLRERISYGFGDFGCNLIYAAMSSFLLFYYTDYAHVDAMAVGSIMLVSKLIDAIFSLVMGQLIDNTKSRFGKARPWILRMMFPFAIGAILLFSIPDSFNNMGKLIYIFITYNLVSSFIYTAINVPYATLNSLITKDQYERSLLNIFRVFMSCAGGLLINSATLPLVEALGDNQSAWTKTFAIFGLGSIIVFTITFLGTKERVVNDSSSKVNTRLSIKESIHTLFVNKYWWIVTLSLIVLFINYALGGGAVVYYAKSVFKDVSLVTSTSIVMNVAQLSAIFFAAPIIKRIGKRNLLIISSIIYALGFLGFVFVNGNIYIAWIACVIKGIGNAGISSCIFAMISDTIEYGAYKTGLRTEGLINSASSVGFKVGTGIGSALLGWILALGDYTETSVEQCDSAIFAINLSFIYLPAIMCIFVVILMLFYKLDKEYDDIVAAQTRK